MLVELIWELVKEIGIICLGGSPRFIGKVPEKMESKPYPSSSFSDEFYYIFFNNY
jgi:hypothetical protein